MIDLYTGTPGSGKTLNATGQIIDWISRGKYVISNYSVSFKPFKRINPRRFKYLDNSEISPQMLTEFARKNFKMGKEGQGLLVLDEASVLLNCRDYNRGDRKEWVQFFQQHRKWGWDCLLITQYDRMLDRQIRSFVEYENIHRNVKNAGTIGKLFKLFGINFFVTVRTWYGMRVKVDARFWFVDRRVSQAYNSWEIIT